MNENIDLVEILKGCPSGTKLYSTVYGEVKLDEIKDGAEPIIVYYNSIMGISHNQFTSDGRISQYSRGECVLFPSKDQRDWRKFKTPIKKFDYSTLNPFDRMLVRDNDRDIWRCNSFTCFGDDHVMCDEIWIQGIPYNEETKRLAGTTDMPDEKYIWWED